MSDMLYEIPEGCDFTAVAQFPQSHPCTPRLLDKFSSKFTGILINGPKEVVWPKGTSVDDIPIDMMGRAEGPLRLMVFGLIQVKYEYLGLYGECGDDVLLVAVNQKTAKTFSGKMWQLEYVAETKPRASEAERKAYFERHRNDLHSSEFELDLVQDLGVPIEDATYTVYAMLGEYKSNILTIRLKLKQ